MDTNDRTGSAFVPMPSRWLNTTPIESDDKPCTLDALEVQAHASGLYAKVSETLTIGNPNRRPISTDIEIAMPDGAVVCGYGLEIDGEIRNGVVVPKEQARVAFETERRRGVDPGLVEAVRGNLYKTRIYPVPAHGCRRIRLDYVAPLSFGDGGQATFELPLPAEKVAKRIIRLEIDIPDCPKPTIAGLRDETIRDSTGVWTLQQEDEGIEATQPVRIGLPSVPSPLVMTERDEDGDIWFCVAEDIPKTSPAEAPAPIKTIVVAWDASGSRAGISHSKEMDLLRSWCNGSAKVILVTFSNEVHSISHCESADDLVAQLDAVRYDGGTNLAALNGTLSNVNGACDGAAGGSVCVLFSDGIDTLSEDRLMLPDGCDMMAVVSGDTHDMEGLRQACRGHAHTPESAPKGLDALADEFSGAATLRRVAVTGTGIADVCDAGIPGSKMRVALGRLTTDTTSVTLGTGGDTIALDASEAKSGTTLSRAWAARRVTLLSPQAQENAEELLRIGRRFGVASPVTSLLVLETLSQWLQYDICPPKSWDRMWQDWQRMRPGRMQESSEESRAAYHLVEVERQWKELLEWWERDHTLDGLRRSVASVAESARAGIGGFLRSRRLSSNAAMRGTNSSDAVADTFRPIPPAYVAGMPDSSPMSPSFPSEPMMDEMDMAVPMMDEESMDDYVESGWDDSADTASFLREATPRRQSLFMAAESSVAPAMEQMRASLAAGEVHVSSDGAIAMPNGSGSMSSGRNEVQQAKAVVRPWMPDAEYLAVLEKARQDGGHDAIVRAYYDMREEHATTPSFFLDCAGWLIAHDDEEMGIRVLTNLAEVSVDDAPTLRILAWRLREAGRLDFALVVLRKVLALRGEDSQSHRDLALVLSELARKAYGEGDLRKASDCVKEAGEHYRTIVLTPWQRRAVAVSLFAVEEYNVMRAWADSQEWEDKPELEPISPHLEGVLECDLRITLAWDADDTDVDIHVTEPSGEEAYYGHRRTFAGGRVSEDITDGYGPELYEIRKASRGEYLIRAHYFASHQQTVFGPATCTLTVYTDWGRPTQSQIITTTRLDQANQMTPVGSVSYGKMNQSKVSPATSEPEDGGNAEESLESQLRIGMSTLEAIHVMGEPDGRDIDGEGTETLVWERNGGRRVCAVFAYSTLQRVIERMPWGDEMVILQ